jgi:hypothetical protein
MIGVVRGEWGVAKTILTSVPDIIAALEPLSKIHPFVQGGMHFLSIEKNSI